MLNKNVIEILVNKGFVRWTKAGKDRLYINPKVTGLIDACYYKSGNVRSCTVDGRYIANNSAPGILSAKLWIDIQDESTHADTLSYISGPNEWALDRLKDYLDDELNAAKTSDLNGDVYDNGDCSE